MKLSFIALPTNPVMNYSANTFSFFNYTMEWSKLSVHFTKKNTIVSDKIILPAFKVMSESYNTVPGMLINIPIRIIKHLFLKE